MSVKIKLQLKLKKPQFNVIDLFCGCGGMTKGLTDAGLHVIAGIDIWQTAIDTYARNFSHNAVCADLTKLAPEDFQKIVGIEKNAIDIIVGSPPCFLAGSKILTDIGYKNIEDVVLTDKLLSHTGVFRNIVNCQKKTYNGEVYELLVECHPSPIRCTKDHPFYVRSKIGDGLFTPPTWKSADKLTNCDYLGMVINRREIVPKFTLGDINFDFNDPARWYIIGYIVGHNHLFDICGNESMDLINQSTDFWKYILDMFSDNIIPEWVQDAPNELISEFIRGYGQSTPLSTDMLYGLQRLHQKLGHLGSPNVYKEGDYVWFPLNNISKCNATNISVYNFEVEIDNSYVVENVIAHNCQGFSIAGKRDKNDPRNSLFMEYVKYLDYFQPKAFMLENVIGILSMKTGDGNHVIDIILDSLGRNYNCITCKLYASDFEVPQNRRRTIIIGIRKDLNKHPYEPQPILSVVNRVPVGTFLLPREQVDNSYYLSDRARDGIMRKKQQSRENGNGFGAQFLDINKPSYTIPARYWKDGYDALVKYSDNEIRRLTILELQRIQSFPDNFQFQGSKKDIIIQIGNAVACRFAYHLGKHLINILQ